VATALKSSGTRQTLEIPLRLAAGATASDVASAILTTQRARAGHLLRSRGEKAIAQFEGILERAPLETRVATVRDLFERVDVDSRELRAVAVWNMTPIRALTGRTQ